MRLVCLAAALFLAACQPAAPSLPSTPPPPPPGAQPVAKATVTGRVVSAEGFTVPGAAVTVSAANAACAGRGAERGVVTDERGEFAVVVEGLAATAHAGCVVVEARSGGASGRSSAPASFSLDREAAVEVTVRLERSGDLDAAEARRLVRLLTDAINDPAAADGAELALYVAQGSEALRVALEQYRKILGDVVAVDETEPSYVRSPSYRHFTFILRGARGGSLNVDVHHEALTRLHSSLLDYGLRSERFISLYLRAISSGDAEMLARLLNPDDVDFPVERAREIITGYRQRFRDTATIRPELVGVDDSSAAITWHLHGIGPDGRAVTEPIVLRHGDGLLGVVGL